MEKCIYLTASENRLRLTENVYWIYSNVCFPWLISNLMHKILIYLYIIHLLKSSTCFEH